MHRLIEHSFAEYRGRLEPPSSALDETVATITAAMAVGGAVLALAGDRPIGAALYRPDAGFLYAGRVSVMPEWRRQGVAQALMGFLETQARSLALSAIEIEVRESLPSNVALYRRLSYRVTASIPHPRGPSFNSLTMRKEV